MVVRAPFLLVFAVIANAQPVDFLKQVQPVLTGKCLSCHAGDNAQGNFRAHTRNDLLKGGNSGPAIVAGQGKTSLLIAKLEGRQGLRMPPSGPPLDAETIRTLARWIDQGAKFDGAPNVLGRVAPLPPRNPEIPLTRLLKASGPAASDSRFARRAWFDITGMPPTPDELQAFEQDQSPDKHERAIDRLLADRRGYAEHWITFWNDLLRNDEGVIYHGERKSITEWLLKALGSNMPYDAMVRSLLNPEPKTGPEGYLTGVTWRGVVSASQTPPMQAAQNAAQVFLGINLKCAGCHDSFINRWKLQDTYGLASMFSSEPLELVRCDVRVGKMAKAQFPYEPLGVTFGTTLASKREAVSNWFVHKDNGRFARTIVNRYWRQLMGKGLVEPVDDMDAEPSNADLLDALAFDFAAKGYDLQWLIRTIVASEAYRSKRVTPRRLTAEQIQDTISVVTGDWRVSSKRTEIYSTYTREWRLKSDALSRALGRPIRDQVYTERNSDATTLQALELTNGPLLSKRLERGALSILGKLPPAPENVFDSKLLRSGSVPVDIDVTGVKQLWLLIDNVDSYDPSRVVAGWQYDPELTPGPKGGYKLDVPHVLDLEGKNYTRFRAKAFIDDRFKSSDIGPAVRFFIFKEKPDPDRLIRIQGDSPAARPPKPKSAADLVDRLYRHLVSRTPTSAERAIAVQIANPLTPEGVEDLLWSLLMTPEFQYIH